MPPLPLFSPFSIDSQNFTKAMHMNPSEKIDTIKQIFFLLRSYTLSSTSILLFNSNDYKVLGILYQVVLFKLSIAMTLGNQRVLVRVVLAYAFGVDLITVSARAAMNQTNLKYSVFSSWFMKSLQNYALIRSQDFLFNIESFYQYSLSLVDRSFPIFMNEPEFILLPLFSYAADRTF